MCRKLICLASLFLALGLVSTNVAFGGKVWETRVSSGTDDAEQDVIGGSMDPSSSDLEIFDDGGLQVIGLRFVEIPIPKGAIVDNAFIELTCDETKSGTQPVSILVEGELNPNPPTFVEATNNITNRPTTTANVVWNPENWTEIGQTDRSSDITSIIQEIIDQADWALGNALVLILRDNPDNPSTGIRCAKCASEPASAPLLHIEFRGRFAVEPIPADGGLYEDTSAALNWLPGLNAVSHNVYFGESVADVEDGTPGAPAFQGNQIETFFTVGIPGTPVPDGLVPGTTYYWRIDEIEADGATINKGDIWSFTVPSKQAYNHSLSDGSYFIDPHTDLSWTAGSGAKIHTVFFGDNFDEVSSAVEGLSQAGTTYDPGPLESEKTYHWRVDEFDGAETHKGDVLSFTTIGAKGTGLRGDYYTGENFDKLVLTRIDPQVDYPDGASPPDDSFGTSNFSARWTGDVSAQFTETYAFYTITDDGIRVWVNSKLIIDHWKHHGNTEDTGTIDLVAGQSYSIELEYFQAGGGAIVQLGWASPHTAKQLIPTDLLWPPVKARNPNPPNSTTGVNHAKILKWGSGEHTVSHRVYFGTDQEAVRNADTGSPEYKDTKELGAESYNPGLLGWDATYYWRVDEVNDSDSDSPWKGSLWSFTTANFPIVDDFENYDVGNNEIWWAWKDGLGYAAYDDEPVYSGNGTGSTVGDETTASYTDEAIVHGGLQAMPLAYDNNKEGYSNYSEAELTLSTTRDWTEKEVNVLSLWFHGISINAAEPLYVAISNSTGTPAIVVHDDPAAAQIDTWAEWVIPLQALADQGIDLTDVDRIAIGLGTRGNVTTPGGSGKMVFDGLRLYRSAAAPTAVGLVGWWELDDGSGTVASDSSGHGNDGVLALNGTAWESTDPAVGAYAIALSGTHATPDTGHVEVAHSDTLSFGTSDFTMAVWARRDAGDDRDDIITKKDDIADLSFYIDSEHRLILYRKGGDSVLSDVTVPTEQWVHLSATRQEGAVQFYINGVPAGSGINDLDLASTGVLRIGSNRRPSDDATMNPFEGLIDDARIYDRALTAAEILELTGQ